MMRLHRMPLRRLFAVKLLLAVAVFGAVTPLRAAFINLTPSNGVNSSSSVLLSDLISGEVMGVTVGDKIFTGFNYSFMGDMPQAIDVQVLGFKDQNGNWGVTFHGTFHDLPGGSTSDAMIRFVVDIDPNFLRQGYRISDAHLFMNGYGVGADSALMVDESFLESNQSMHVYTSSINGGGTQNSDWVYFDPTLSTLHVVKDIFAMASNNSILPARATVIDQSFSQIIVPEPAAGLLMLCGITCLGFARKRHRLER